MKTLTIRTNDTEIENVLKQQSSAQGKSINSLVIDAITKVFLPGKNQIHSDLDSLFGIWSSEDADVFNEAVQDLQKVAPEDWL